MTQTIYFKMQMPLEKYGAKSSANTMTEKTKEAN